MSEQRLWLWKNFVDGKPEYWAFDNPYPCVTVGGDPLTLGEPCGWAIFKPSVNGRPNLSEQEVIDGAIRRTSLSPVPAEQQVPPGWKLVPVVPTEDMRIAGFESEAWDSLSSAVLRKKGWPYSCKQSAECVAELYRAMLDAASPLLPSQGDGGGVQASQAQSSCETENDCTQMPWCRLRGACQQVAATERQIISGLLELVRDMGCVIRRLDEAGDFSHFWQNDGGYVPDGRYRAGLDSERFAPPNTADTILRELVESCDALDASLHNFKGDDDEAVQDRHRAAWQRAKEYVSGVPVIPKRVQEGSNSKQDGSA